MNVTDTISSQTYNYVGDLIRNLILPRIVNYVNDREEDDQVTVEELEKMLSLQTVKSYAVKQTPSNAKKRCIWEFKRGKVKGSICDKPALEGSDYCSYCSNRECIKSKKNSANSTANASLDLPKSARTSPLVDVIVYNQEKNLFLDEVNNYIFLQEYNEEGEPTRAILVGKLDYSDGIQRLTNDEVYKATSDGVLVDEEFDLTDC